MIFFSGRSLSRERNESAPTLFPSPLLRYLLRISDTRTDAIFATSAAFFLFITLDRFLYPTFSALASITPLSSKQLCLHFGLVPSISVHLRSASLAYLSSVTIFDINRFHYAQKFDKRTRARFPCADGREIESLRYWITGNFVGWTSTYTFPLRVSERTDRR